MASPTFARCEAGFVRIRQLYLHQFRNYETLDAHFEAEVVTIGGPNGSGKTNILDAIYLLATGKSYFNLQDKQLIRHGAGGYAVSGRFEDEAGEAFRVQCRFREGRKQLKLDEKEYGRLADHYGKIPLTLVAPQDTELITGGSAERRRFVDGLISQYRPDYLHALLRYNRALQQRNTLFKQHARQRPPDRALLEPYDHELAEQGRFLHQMRCDFQAAFSTLFTEAYRALSGGAEAVRLEHRSQLYHQDFVEGLRAAREQDAHLQRTTFGAHRDDWSFLLEELPIRRYGSQGQQKTYLLALKLARHQWLSRRTGKRALLLLDDVYDRLDQNRMQRLVEWLFSDACGQAFLTDTDPERLQALVRGQGASGQCLRIEERQLREVAGPERQ